MKTTFSVNILSQHVYILVWEIVYCVTSAGNMQIHADKCEIGSKSQKPVEEVWVQLKRKIGMRPTKN